MSSSNLAVAPLDLGDLMMEKGVKTGNDGKEPYDISKLANSICMMKLAKTLGQEKAGVKLIQLCPGFVKSEVFRNEKGFFKTIKNSISLGVVGLSTHSVSTTSDQNINWHFLCFKNNF